MNCDQDHSLLSLYLDDALSPAEMRQTAQHIEICEECRKHFESLKTLQQLVASVGREPAPADLALRIRVAISQQRGMSFPRQMQGLLLRVENAVNAVMLPATAGVVTAVIMFGLLIGFLAVPKTVSASNDIPTSLYMQPRLVSSPFAKDFGPENSDAPVVIEVQVDANGRLQEYRVIAGEDTEQVRRELDRALIFTVFEPAKSFGRPAPGRVVLSFSNVNVKG